MTGGVSLPCARPPREPPGQGREQPGTVPAPERDSGHTPASWASASPQGRGPGHAVDGGAALPSGNSEPRLGEHSKPGPKPCAERGTAHPWARDATGDHSGGGSLIPPALQARKDTGGSGSLLGPLSAHCKGAPQTCCRPWPGSLKTPADPARWQDDLRSRHAEGPCWRPRPSPSAARQPS